MKRCITLLIWLAFSHFAHAQYHSNSNLKQQRKSYSGAYVESGLGYFQNITSGQTNHIWIQQIPGAPYNQVTYTNSGRANGPGLYLGGGYQWMINPQWSWSLGVRFSHYSITQTGRYDFSGAISDYTYDTSALLINLTTRLYWHATRHNIFYGEVNAGLANLHSQNFHLNHTSGTVRHNDITSNNVDCGLAVGWLYQFSSHTGLNTSLGYQELGKSILGKRITPNQSKGSIAQLLNGFKLTFGLVHRF